MASDKVLPLDIWLVYLRFTDRPKVGKVRPVLVVGAKESIVLVAKITSKPPIKDSGDIAITQWEQAGLNVPSTVRCSQVFEISSGELLRDAPIGALQPYDAEQVVQAMAQLGLLSAADTLEW